MKTIKVMIFLCKKYGSDFAEYTNICVEMCSSLSMILSKNINKSF